MKITARLPVLVFLVTCASAGIFAAACSSSGDPVAPSRSPVRPSFEEDAATTSSSGAPDQGGALDGGCFDAATAPPTGLPQFLNQCNASGCFPFDNTTRVEGFKPGSPLPSLD